ncbi:6540_t:CDS:2 [Acaulospora morrowiae]|uniref:6540_t:CDS:1 n=1 Tax=Acaulospora morrowiae TaxID=94023 RepID=A0A9N9BQB3_9GLOM|nr:6540_t:CDS:2 [Acaulospora morrowiae]
MSEPQGAPIQKIDPPFMLASDVTYQSQPPPQVQVESRGVTYAEAPPQPNVVYVENTPPPAQTVIMQDTYIAPISSPLPTTTTCPNCRNMVTTIVTEVPGSTTYILSVILCFVCFVLAWLPFVMSGCLDKVHSCPICRTVLATVRA